MKFYILALLVVAAQAIQIPVHNGSDTCLLIQLEGQVELTANKTNTILQFDNATLVHSSDCTLVKLNLTESVEVWFQFNNKDDKWQVIPEVQFVPKIVFPEYFSNYSDSVNYSADPLESLFNKNESYKCSAKTDLTFKQIPKQELQIIVNASTINFQIQSLNSKTFVAGEDCKADKPTIPTTPIPITTTHEPVITKQNFSCDYENVTKFLVSGSFALTITYTAGGKKAVKSFDVPVVHLDNNDTHCSSNVTETLIIPFFTNWSIEFTFTAEGSNKYYVSNISVTYDHDLLTNSSVNGSVTVYNSKPKFLEASGNGYYTCRHISLVNVQDVTLTANEFSYKAFNTKGNIDFKKGEVTECSGDEETSSVVPIAVGAALAGLVVIVLIAYLIGRRRSRKAGYESV